MKLTGLLPHLHKLPAYGQLRAESSPAPLGLPRAARPFLAAGLAADSSGPLLIVTGSGEQAQQWVEALSHFLPTEEEGGPPLLLCPEPDALPFERINWTDRTRQARLTALAALQRKGGAAPVVVAPVRALLQKTLPARELRLSLRPLSVGAFIRLDETITRWVQAGYEPAEVVEEPGTFARRGGLVDIWPPNLPYPVRVDLFGDEVESLRVFDPNSQRTERRVNRIEIGPGSEALSKYGERVAGAELPVTSDPLAVSSHQSPVISNARQFYWSLLTDNWSLTGRVAQPVDGNRAGAGDIQRTLGSVHRQAQNALAQIEQGRVYAGDFVAHDKHDPFGIVGRQPKNRLGPGPGLQRPEPPARGHQCFSGNAGVGIIAPGHNFLCAQAGLGHPGVIGPGGDAAQMDVGNARALGSAQKRTHIIAATDVVQQEGDNRAGLGGAVLAALFAFFGWEREAERRLAAEGAEQAPFILPGRRETKKTSGIGAFTNPAGRRHGYAPMADVSQGSRVSKRLSAMAMGRE